jgi:hypothetical protein
LIRAFERGDQEDEFFEDEDPHISKYIHEFKKVEEVIGPVLEEEEEVPPEDEFEEEGEEPAYTGGQ